MGKMLWEQAYWTIRDDIIRCTLPPGAEVTEMGMVERYNKTKASIRRALNRLAHEGLVRPYLRRGYVVSPITVRDIHDVYDVRALLEPAAAVRAIGRVDIDELRTLNTSNQSDPFGYIDANAQFHNLIASHSGNRLLAESVSNLVGLATRIIWLGLYAAPLPPSVLEERREAQAHEHDAIIDAFARQDANEVSRLMITHVESTRTLMIDALLKRNDAQPQNHAYSDTPL